MKVHCAYGTGWDTTEQLIYNDLSSKPVFLKGDGDGTVNLKSLEVSSLMEYNFLSAVGNFFQGCKRWKETIPKEFPGLNHGDLVKGDEVTDWVRDLLRPSSWLLQSISSM